jgi:hypothetical protein
MVESFCCEWHSRFICLATIETGLGHHRSNDSRLHAGASQKLILVGVGEGRGRFWRHCQEQFEVLPVTKRVGKGAAAIPWPQVMEANGIWVNRYSWQIEHTTNTTCRQQAGAIKG